MKSGPKLFIILIEIFIDNSNMNKENKKILVTKEFLKDDEFDKILTQEGFELVYFPTIKISGIKDFTELDEILAGLNKYDGIFFTSANAVIYFFERANALGIRYSGKIYTVGEKTRSKLESYSYKSYSLPEKYSAEGLLESSTARSWPSTGRARRRVDAHRGYEHPPGNASGNRGAMPKASPRCARSSRPCWSAAGNG